MIVGSVRLAVVVGATRNILRVAERDANNKTSALKQVIFIRSLGWIIFSQVYEFYYRDISFYIDILDFWLINGRSM